MMRFEPMTSCLQDSFLTNWAIKPLSCNQNRSTELIDIKKWLAKKDVFWFDWLLESTYLWNQASRRIDNIFSSISIVTIVNHFPSFAKGAKTKGFIVNEFISRKTVMKFNNINVTRFEKGQFIMGYWQVVFVSSWDKEKKKCWNQGKD